MAMTINTTGTSKPAAPVPVPGAQGAPRDAAKAGAVMPEPTPQRQAPPPPPPPEQVQKAIQALKQLIETKAPNSLAFSVDDSSGRTVVRITDQETGETIRQIPSEEMLEIARSLDKFQGMLVQQKA